MLEKLLIVVAVKDRIEVTRRCLENLAAVKAPQDMLAVFNDASKEYDATWCRLFGDLVFNTEKSLGIHRQRALHFQLAKKLFDKDPEFTRLYFTDADVIHDPEWRAQAIRLQDANDGSPVCLYDTLAHSCLEGNTLKDEEGSEVILRRFAPGVSYLLTRDHVDVLIERLPIIANGGGWDWEVPNLLGNMMVISRVGYCDHIGIGGERHPKSDGPDGGDRVKQPTPFLVNKRAEIVRELTNTIASQ